jgi:Xaa-Pro dipeptidase
MPRAHECPASRRDVLALGGALAGAGAIGCRAGPVAAARPPDELDELFADLTDQSGRWQPITESERAPRRMRLGRWLSRHGFDALLCEGGATMSYLAGIRWGHSERAFALAVLADGSHFWICPRFEAEKARLAIEAEDGPTGEIVTWDEHEYAWKPLAAAFRERRVERIAVDPATRFFVADELAREIGRDKVANGAEVVLALRGVKEPRELELIRAANELTQRAIVAVSERLRPGMTGADVATRMQRAQQRLGLKSPWVLALIGPAAAYPHGDDHSIVLAPGELLLVDTGGSLHGYQSDATRTWCAAGKPSEDRVRAWHAVRDAQRRAFDAIRPGVRCSEIDRVARASLETAGYGSGYDTFTHRLGHGIGLEGHEPPYFDGGSEVALEPGMTLSNEPGIYLYGRFGVRIEDIVAVTAEGADHFGSWQQGPRSPA